MRFGFLLTSNIRFSLVATQFVALLGYLWWEGYFSHRTALVFVGLFAAGPAAYALGAIGWWTVIAWVAVLNVALGLTLVFNEPTESIDRP